jgi:hypothetical protein
VFVCIIIRLSGDPNVEKVYGGAIKAFALLR